MESLISMVAPISAAAAGLLVGAMWQGVILAASVALCLQLLPRLTAAARSALWTGVLLLVVSLHFVPLLNGISASSAKHGGMQHSPLHIDVRWSLAVAGVWALLSAVRGIQLIRSAVYLRRIARQATPLELAGAQVREAGRGMFGMSREVKICTSADVDRPSVVGFFSPRILVPSALLERLSETELEQILLHEMEHLRRVDDWTNLLQKISLVLFPLNPALFWVERRLCLERELACDDHVLSATGARKAYATCLTNLAGHTLMRRGAALALGAWERRSELANRVYRILRSPERGMRPWQVKLAMSTLALGLLGGAVSLARSPQLVSFAPATPVTEAHAQAAGTSLDLTASRLQRVAFQKSQDSKLADSATLVKAVMPVRRASSAIYKAKPHPRRVTNGPTAKNQTENRRTQPSWVVLTEWREMPTRPVPAVWQEIRPAYAAVPMGNGWLILQL